MTDETNRAAADKAAADKAAGKANPGTPPKPHPRVRVPAKPAPNPPPQPAMVPAKQIAGATSDVLTPPPTRRPTGPGGLKVVATKLGYYDDKLQRVGDVFTLHQATDFSATWMAEADVETPDHTTTSNAALRREHDVIVGAPTAPRAPIPLAERPRTADGLSAPATGAADPLGYANDPGPYPGQ